MTYGTAAWLGVVAWGGLFLVLLAAMAIEADMEKRWSRDWVGEWEKRNGTSIDALAARLDAQMLAARSVGRALNWIIAAALFLLAVLAVFQFGRDLLSPAGFKGAMFFGAMMIGLLFLPLRAAAEVWLGLVRAMRRRIRVVTEPRLVIERGVAVDSVPKPVPEKKKPAPAAKTPPPPSRPAAAPPAAPSVSTGT